MGPFTGMHQRPSMGRLLARGVSMVLLAIVACCGKRSGPLQPSTVVSAPDKTGSSTVAAVVTSLTMNGPVGLSPGETGRYTAIASYSDGTTRDITVEAQWSSTDESVLAMVGPGALAARSSGEAQVQVSFGTRSVSRDVIVIPKGLFLLDLFVTDEQASARLDGVRVEVVSGPGVGLAVTTDWDGQAKLVGVAQDIELRFTKDGYQPTTQRVSVDHNQAVSVQLMPSKGRLNLSGQYQLTLTSGSCAADGPFPDAARARTYTARLWNAGLEIIAELSDANLQIVWCRICNENRGNRFTGWTQAQGARFTLIDYTAPDDYYDGIYPNVVERLSDGTLLTISGHAVVAPTSNGFAGTLDGSFAIYRSLELNYPPSAPTATCRSTSHRFVLTRY